MSKTNIHFGKVFLFIIAITLSTLAFCQTRETYLTTTTWTCPQGVTSIMVESWGGGGAGGGASTGGSAQGGGGGGGGAYSKTTNVPVIVGTTYNITVGAGGSGSIGDGGNGSNSFFNINTALANGGNGGFANNGAGGTGGLGTYKGGNGYRGNTGTPGGGGGSGGTAANGNNPTGTSGATAVTGGGKGGNGGSSNPSNGAEGGFVGGGGGGAKKGSGAGTPSGGNGANGQIIITYVILVPTISAISTNICAGGSITITGNHFYGITAANVKIGTTPVTSITSFTSTQIIAVMGTASWGKVNVTTAGITATSVGTFTVTAATVGGSVSGSTAVCAGSNSGSLYLSGHNGNILRWESSTNGGSTWSSITNIGNAQNYSGLTQTTQYRAVVKNGPCSSENSLAATIQLTTTLHWGGNGSTMSGGTNGTDFNAPANWSTNQTNFAAANVAPNQCMDVVIDLSLNATITTSIITFSNSATTIKSLNFSVKGSSNKATIYDAMLRLGNQSLTISGTTTLYSENNALNKTTQLSLEGTDNGSLFIFEGDLITNANNKAGGTGECIVYPFSNPVGTINKGKFVLKGNATLSGVGDDAYPQLNKPTYLVFDGAGTQTITNNNSNGYPVYLGFNTQIGEVNSPTVILNGTNTFGFQTINNLTVKSGATLEIEAGQSINRYTPGTPSNFNLMANAVLKLGGNNYGIGNSNFPKSYNSVILAPTSTVEYNGTGNQSIYSTSPYGNLIVSNSGIKTTGGNTTMLGNLNIHGTAILNGSSFSHFISGNWYNNALPTSLTGPTSTVTFQGGSNQIIGGSAGTAFNNLVIYKTSSLNTVTNASAAFSSAGNLTVTRGNLVLQSIDNDYSFQNVIVQPNGKMTHSVSWDATYRMMSISGNLDVTGIFNPTVRSHVQMNGTGSKTIRTGNNLASTLSILTFNNGNFIANGTLKTNQEVWAMFGAPGSFSTNGQDVTFAFLLNNNGTVNVNGGSLRLNGGAQIGMGTLPNPGRLNITAGIATVVGDLNIENSGNVLVNSAKLQISGAISNPAGIFTATNGTIEMNGTAAQNIAGSLFDQKTIMNLIVSNPATLSVSPAFHDTLKISGTLSFDHVSAKLNTGNNLTLLSNASRTANVGKVGIKNSITGNTTVERFINIGTSSGQHAKSWQFLSVSTTGKTIRETWMENGLKTTTPNRYGTWLSGKEGIPGGFDVYSGTPSIKTYDPLTKNWIGVSNPTITQIYNTSGYMVFVRGDRSVFNFSGANSAPVETTLRTTGALHTGDQAAITVIPHAYQSIGNPYASAIDFKKINKSTGVDDKFYVWDPNLNGTYGLGGYQTVSSVNGWKPIPGGTIPYPTGVDKSTIQSGQAFFIYTTGVAAFGPVTYSVNFKEETKVSENAMKSFARPMGIQEGSKPQLFAVSLYTGVEENDLIADGNVVAFDDSYTNSIDGNDALKITNEGENFGLKREGKLLALEARKTVTDADTIYYHITKLKQRTYQLRFAPENMENAGLEAFLHDKLSNTLTPVSLYENNFVNISVTKAPESAAADRFKVIFRPMAPLPVTFTTVKAVQKNADIFVEWKVENESNMVSYEVEKSLDGIKFIKQNEIAATNGISNQYQWLDKKASQGYQYYRIHSKELNGQSGYSQIVKVLIGTTLPEISVYPNPSKGENIQVQLINQPSGRYGIRLLNSLGQVIYSKTFEQQNGSATQTIQWNTNWSNGIYQLEVSKPGGEVEVIRVMR